VKNKIREEFVRLINLLLITSVIAFFLFSCGDSGTNSNDEPEPQLSEGLVGSWKAVKVLFTNQADTTQKADLSQYITLNVVVQKDSTYSFSTVVFGQNITDTGLISSSGDHLNFTSSQGDDKEATYTITDNILDLHIYDQAYDFELDGTDEIATLYAQLEKIN
jgi:hypothetical protein